MRNLSKKLIILTPKYFPCSRSLLVGAPLQQNQRNRRGNILKCSNGRCVTENISECKKANIAFLLDGSGSVSGTDFSKMKVFVTNLISSLQQEDAKASQRHRSQYFIFSGTFASNADKILIVITDGEPSDPEYLPSAIYQAQSANIVRYAIGVGRAFKSYSGKRELDSIASYPPQKHVFQVESFQALENIRKTLQSQIFPIEGTFKILYYKSKSNFMFFVFSVCALTILGGPRYQHRGAVEVVFRDTFKQVINPSTLQTGEYFGAVVCAMDVDNDSISDVILISSPMYKETDREGRVYVYPTTKGRFGSALAVLPDLNMDTFNDLAVGAPLEDDDQGSIYIFHGERGKSINPTYSQVMQSGLKFFGVSFTQWSSDQSGDRLPDLVLTLIYLYHLLFLTVEPSVTFSQEKISTRDENCSKDLKTTARVCFFMKKRSAVDTGSKAKITYTLTLDATRKLPNSRAYIAEKQRHQTSSLEVGLRKTECHSIEFFIQDINNPGFEQKCFLAMLEDGYIVHFVFSVSSALVKVGIDELVNVTVSLENREENSYNSHVTLTYPAGISYRKFTIIKGRIECNSSDSEDGQSRGNTVCTVDKPIFKRKSKVKTIFFTAKEEFKGIFHLMFHFTVSLEYDQDQYIFFSTTSTHKPPVQVEIYSDPDFTKEIVGGSLGGLVFVALVTAGLYKAGFFKSKYSQMINENANAADPDADPDTGPPLEA
uniref:VWFA domain-containing protein n=1 Tax=Oryzias latipes TaxID=8090 RepID=A0A3P9MCR3_ORYLA